MVLILERSGLSQEVVITSIAAAGISSVVATVVGHPLDTIRVKMQLDSQSASFLQSAAQLVKSEGPLSLFKGMS